MPSTGKSDDIGRSEAAKSSSVDSSKKIDLSQKENPAEEVLNLLLNKPSPTDKIKQLQLHPKIKDALERLNSNQEKIKQLQVNQNFEDALEKLNSNQEKIKDALSSFDKWQNILRLKEGAPEELGSFLNSLNSRSLIAFKKKAINQNENSLAESISLLLEKRKQSVNESLASRIQVNFRLSEENTDAVNKISHWIKRKGSITFLDQVIDSKELSSKNYLPRLILESSIKYLYLAFLNDTQTDSLATRIAGYRLYEDISFTNYIADKDINKDGLLLDEKGFAVSEEQYLETNYRPRCYEEIMRDMSEEDDIPLALLRQFWDDAFERSDKILTQHLKELEEEDFDEVSKLRSKIFKEFNTINKKI